MIRSANRRRGRFIAILTLLVGVLAACSSSDTSMPQPSPAESDAWHARLRHALVCPLAPVPSQAVPPVPIGDLTCEQVQIQNEWPPLLPNEHQIWVVSAAEAGEDAQLGCTMSVSSTYWTATNCPSLTEVIEGKIGDYLMGILQLRIGQHTVLRLRLTHATSPTPLPSIWDIMVGSVNEPDRGIWLPPSAEEMYALDWLASVPGKANFEILDTLDCLKTYNKCQRCDFTNYLFEGFSIPASASLANSDATGALFRNMSFGRDVDYTGVNFTNATFEDVTMQSPNFRGKTFKGTTFTGATTLISADFTEATLDGVIFTGSTTLKDPVFNGATLKGATTFSGSASMESPDLRGATFDGVVFDGEVVFSSVELGKDPAGRCTQLKNTAFTRMSLAVSRVDNTCLGTHLFPGSMVQPKSVSHIDWTYLDWGDAILVSEGTDSAYLRGVDLAHVFLQGAVFWGAPLDLTGTSLSEAHLDQATFPGVDFTNADLTNVSAKGASFAASTFRNTDLSGSQSNFTGAGFVNADLTETNFMWATISGTDFSGARAENTKFGDTNAENAVFVGTHIFNYPDTFQNSILTGADFTSALLGGMPDVEGGVDFSSAHLSSANFDHTQCVGCNFSQAHLDQSRFVAAYLPGAVFSGADLTGAHLLNAFTTKDAGTWNFNIGIGEPPFSVKYSPTDWAGADTTGVTTCPNGGIPDKSKGCQDRMEQEDPGQTPLPPPCSPSGEDSCAAPFATLAGNGSAGYGDEQVNHPGDVVVKSESVIYFADTGNCVVRKLVVGRPPATPLAGTPGKPCPDQAGTCGDDGPATAASLVEPVGLALAWDGTVYIADRGGNKIRRVAPNGTIHTVAGTGEPCQDPTDSCGDGGDPLEAQLTAPAGVWVDPVGNVYIADSGNNRIRVVTTSGEIHTIAGSGEPCEDPTGACGDGSIAQQARLTGPSRVVGDGLGNLYIADTGAHKIRRLAPDNTITTVFGTGEPGYNGTYDASKPLEGTQAQLNTPTGIAVNAAGALFVADTGNGLIRSLSTKGFVGLTAGLTNDEDTQTIQGWNGDGLWANETKLDGPLGIAVTPRNQYVTTDTNNQRVRAFGP